ncbi:hypothetical protein [Chloroflexus sp.]|uniref:hypothetical protein n=1 Tax=Chloroflexus sp. TaxID=1904827 RepID=UPI002ACEC314|nr:hypothetical protein [Chloroflexus sp.]
MNDNNDSASELFTCLDTCERLPALDTCGTGGGLILTPEHINALLAAAARLFPILPSEIREGTIHAYLAAYVLQCPWRILYDCQREPMLQALDGYAQPTKAAVLAGTPKKSKSRSRRAA